MSFFDKLLDQIHINDDYDEDEEDGFFDEDDEEDDYEEELPKKRFFSRRSKASGDESEVDYTSSGAAEARSVRRAERPTKSEPAKPRVTVRQPAKSKPSSKVTPIRSNRKGASAETMEVCVIRPTRVEDYREIADTLLSNCPVILNLEGLDVEVAQRIIDFSSGSCYAIDGSLQKVSSYIFVLTPSNVEITGDIQDILNGAIPEMRSSF